MACALAAPPKKAFDAYRSAVGTCGGSAAELDRLAPLATVGEAVAARLDDGALEHASRSLAHDAVWWRFLKRGAWPSTMLAYVCRRPPLLWTSGTF